MQCYHLENGGENAGEIGGRGQEGRKQSARSLGRRWETEETSGAFWIGCLAVRRRKERGKAL